MPPLLQMGKLRLGAGKKQYVPSRCQNSRGLGEVVTTYRQQDKKSEFYQSYTLSWGQPDHLGIKNQTTPQINNRIKLEASSFAQIPASLPPPPTYSLRLEREHPQQDPIPSPPCFRFYCLTHLSPRCHSKQFGRLGLESRNLVLSLVFGIVSEGGSVSLRASADFTSGPLESNPEAMALSRGILL